MASLTDKSIKSAKPGEKPIHLADGEGLLLLVNPKIEMVEVPVSVPGKGKNVEFWCLP